MLRVENAQTVKSDDGDLEGSKPPARKRTKVCGQRLSQATASDGPLQKLGEDTRVLLNVERTMQTELSSMGMQARQRQEFSTPPSSPISSRVATNADHVMQTERSSMGMQARQRQAFSTPPSSPISPSRMAMNADHEFSAPWHHHTGLLGGSTNSCDDWWTPGSSSCALTPSSFESPETRPLDVAITHEDGIPILLLPPVPTILAPQTIEGFNDWGGRDTTISSPGRSPE